jgi:hypothetical protein
MNTHMNKAYHPLLVAATMMLASCGGGGDVAPTPDPVAPSPPTTEPAPAPQPQPTLPVIVGQGAASDCFNPDLFKSSRGVFADYKESRGGKDVEDIRTSTAIFAANFKSIAISELTTRGGQVFASEELIRYVIVDGLDIVTTGFLVQKRDNGLAVEQPTPTIFVAPLPRDKSFALQPGGSHTTHYTVANSDAKPENYSVTTHYLGQENLVVRGVSMVTCKFQTIDSRSSDTPKNTWLVKSPDSNKGIAARIEGLDGRVPFVRDLTKASIVTLSVL